jgi:hypothetical protein
MTMEMKRELVGLELTKLAFCTKLPTCRVEVVVALCGASAMRQQVCSITIGFQPMS